MTTKLVLVHESMHVWKLETALSKHPIATFNVVHAYDAVLMSKNFLSSFNLCYTLEIVDEHKRSHYSPQDRRDEMDNGKQ